MVAVWICLPGAVLLVLASVCLCLPGWLACLIEVAVWLCMPGEVLLVGLERRDGLLNMLGDQKRPHR